MSNSKELIEAQMHLECINEAFLELQDVLPLMSKEKRDARERVIWAELGSRIWAAILLVQTVRMGKPSDGLEEVCREANAFNGTDEADKTGMH